MKSHRALASWMSVLLLCLCRLCHCVEVQPVLGRFSPSTQFSGMMRAHARMQLKLCYEHYCKMKHLIIKNCLTTMPTMFNLGHVQSNVVKHMKVQAQEKPHLSWCILSQRSIGFGQLPLLVSLVLKPFGGNSEIEAINVDALPDDTLPIEWYIVGSEQVKESGSMFMAYICVQSKSCCWLRVIATYCNLLMYLWSLLSFFCCSISITSVMILYLILTNLTATWQITHTQYI